MGIVFLDSNDGGNSLTKQEFLGSKNLIDLLRPELLREMLFKDFSTYIADGIVVSNH